MGKYFLIACDGSEFNIARNPVDTPSFNPPNKTAKKGVNMIHTISLYDILNKRYIDLEVQPAKKINFLACAASWTGIPMAFSLSSLLTEDLPVIMSLPMPLKTTLTLPYVQRIPMSAGCCLWNRCRIPLTPQWNSSLPRPDFISLLPYVLHVF